MSDKKIQILKMSVLSMQVCAPATATKEEIEAGANAECSTGISSRWAIDETFEPQAVVCSDNPDRRHWILNC